MSHEGNDGVLTDYLNPAELAAELGISGRTLERWNRLGNAPPRTRLGKRIVFRREAVAKWLRSREQAAKRDGGNDARPA